MAKTSIRECLVITSIAYRANYLTETYEQESRQFLMELTKMSGALISSLQRSQNNGNVNYQNNGNQQNTGNYNGNSINEEREVPSENFNENFNENF